MGEEVILAVCSRAIFLGQNIRFYSGYFCRTSDTGIDLFIRLLYIDITFGSGFVASPKFAVPSTHGFGRTVSRGISYFADTLFFNAIVKIATVTRTD